MTLAFSVTPFWKDDRGTFDKRLGRNRESTVTSQLALILVSVGMCPPGTIELGEDAYMTLSGFSRKWMIGPDDPGVGHVYETKTSGATWSDVSVGLPDVPMDDVVYRNGKLVVATDFGVFTSADNGATWFRYGTGLPNVVVAQLTQDPNGNLVAATHGRGIWTIPAP